MKTVYSIVATMAFAASFGLLSGCEQQEESEVDAKAEVTLDGMKDSADQLIDNTRSALDSAVIKAREVGGRSEEALRAAGNTIAEHSDETISAARDATEEFSEKGGDAAKELAEKARTLYSSVEEEAGKLIEKRASDDASDK